MQPSLRARVTLIVVEARGTDGRSSGFSSSCRLSVASPTDGKVRVSSPRLRRDS